MDEEAKRYAEKARNSCRAAILLQKQGLIADAFSRAYYSAFNASRAIMLKAGVQLSKTHSGMVARLWESREKLGIDANLVQNLSRYQTLREGGDYAPLEDVRKEDLEEILADIRKLFKLLGEKLD
ncbi:MAG: HEPN domain-containing protein [Candidatus Micrarchaeota archaeon]